METVPASNSDEDKRIIRMIVVCIAAAVLLLAVTVCGGSWLHRTGEWRNEDIALLFGAMILFSLSTVALAAAVRGSTVALKKTLGRPVRHALWDVTSQRPRVRLAGARRLAQLQGRYALNDLYALRQVGADVPNELTTTVRQHRPEPKRSGLKSARIAALVVLAMSCWYALMVGISAAISPTARFHSDRTLMTQLNLALIAAEFATGFLGGLVCVFLLTVLQFYPRHHERELIWKLNSSEKSEKIKAAEKLAIWGTDKSVNELFETSHDDDSEVREAAGRAYLVIASLYESRSGYKFL